MFIRTLTTAVVVSLIVVSGSAFATISIEKKAELIAEVINASTPKTVQDITITEASSHQNQVRIDMVINKPVFSMLTDKGFDNFKPAFSKAFATSICEDPKQREFIANGGQIKYVMKVMDKPWTIEAQVQTCGKKN
jgi:hypothetical protein